MTTTKGIGRILKKCSCPNKKTCQHGWTFRWWADGKQREETFSTMKLATDRQAQVYRDKRAGEATFADKSKSGVAFNDYCSEWIERGKSREESTKKTYRCTYRQFAPKLEGRSLAWVAQHRTEVEDIINSLPGSYVARSRNIITGTIKAAVIAGDLSGHRLQSLDIGKQVRLGQADFYAATDLELEKLALELGDTYGLLVWLGRYAGLRCGEILGVNKSDLVTKPGAGLVLRIQRQRMTDGKIKPYLKARAIGDAPRDIPVSPKLADKLAEAQTDSEGYYFPAHWRKPVQNRFDAAKIRAGLPKSFTPHDLRDIFATTLLSRGARLDLVSKLLGHKSVETTSVYYAFWLPSDYDVIRDLL